MNHHHFNESSSFIKRQGIVKLKMKNWAGPLISMILFGVLIASILTYRPVDLEIDDPAQGFVSLIFLALGMISQYGVWHTSVEGAAGNIPKSYTFCSHALTVWGKYVPGKIWSVLGRASLLGHYSGLSTSRLIIVSSTAQISMVAAGATIALPILLIEGIVAHTGNLLVGLLAAAVACVALITGTILIRHWHRSGLSSMTTWTRIFLPISFSVLTWILWGLGFHCMLSMSSYMTSTVADVASFAAGTTAGIVTAIAPGGLGVREGAITTILNIRGLEWGDAAVVALAARIWFALGEIGIFVMGLEIRRLCLQRN